MPIIYRRAGSILCCIDVATQQDADNFDKNYDGISCICKKCQEKNPRIFHFDGLENNYSKCLFCNTPLYEKCDFQLCYFLEPCGIKKFASWEGKNYCLEHKDIMCECGKKATKECDRCEPFMCKQPLCDECKCRNKR